MNKKELIIEIKKLYPYYKNLQKMKIAELKELYEKNCDNFTLKNERNSCYMDALFVALFHDKNKYIYNLFLNSDLNLILDPILNLLFELVIKFVLLLLNMNVLILFLNNLLKLLNHI